MIYCRGRMTRFAQQYASIEVGTTTVLRFNGYGISLPQSDDVFTSHCECAGYLVDENVSS